jgi:hypothetical protein
MRTKRLRMRKMRTRRERTKNNRRKGGANTTRKAIMRGKINLLKAKCNEKYNQKEVDKQLKKIEKNLEEIMYQKEKLEFKKKALTECQFDNGIKSESSKSFESVRAENINHAKVIKKRESPKFVDGFGFPSKSASYAEESF